MGFPTYVAGATATFGGAFTWSATKPAGLLAGDLLFIMALGDAGSLGAPSGFTTLWGVSGTGGQFYLLCYKVAGSSEPASYSGTQQFDDSGGRYYTFMYRNAARGVPPSIPVATPGAYDSDGGSTIPFPAVTPTRPTSLAVVVAQAYSVGSIGTPSGFTARLTDGVSGFVASISDKQLTSLADSPSGSVAASGFTGGGAGQFIINMAKPKVLVS